MSSKSKKGSAFERQFCKTLSLWWTEGNRDDVFWRTSNSGGRATTRAKQGKSTANQYGDICAVDEIGIPFTSLFLTELKCGYSKHNLFDLLDKTKGVPLYGKWIQKLESTVMKHNALYWDWLLVTKRNGCRPIAIFSEVLIHQLVVTKNICQSTIQTKIGKDHHSIVVCSLDDFLKCTSPKIIQKVYKERYQ